MNTPPDTASSRSESTADPASPAADACDEPGYMVPDCDLEQLQQRLVASLRYPQISTLDSPAAVQDQLLSIYTASICTVPTTSPTLPRELCLFREWLKYVPPYLGTSGVLDDSMMCLTIAHLGRLNHNKDMIRDTKRIYVRAIHRLHHILKTPERRSSQTLCATLFLSQYEFLACSPETAWVQHAGGAAELMRRRGPEAHKQGFENAMLRAFRPKMICKALVSRVDCFLDNKDWRAVLHHEPQAQGLNPPQSVRLSDEFYEILATLPGLIKWTNSLHAAPNPTGEEMQHVLHRARELQASLMRWHTKFTAGTNAPFLKVPSGVSGALFPTVYQYENHHTTGLICSYYASLIVINDIITSFPPSDDLSEVNRRYAKEICKSVEYAHASGFLGAYSIIFPLTAAYLASGPEIRSWIKNWPGRFEEYFDVKVWEVFDDMDAMGGLVEKRRHGGNRIE